MARAGYSRRVPRDKPNPGDKGKKDGSTHVNVPSRRGRRNREDIQPIPRPAVDEKALSKNETLNGSEHGTPTGGRTDHKTAPNAKQKLTGGKSTAERRERRLPGFLRLPVELRWEIYGYLFDTCRVEIFRRKSINPNKPKQSYYRLYHRQLPPRDTVTQVAPLWSARFVPHPLPTALLFICRRTHSDALAMLYSKTQFVFNSTRAAHRFLTTTNPVAQNTVRHVELNHHMYNEPRFTNFRLYKHRSDFAWYLACEGMSDRFPSLKVLHINMTIRDWPIHLELDERWTYPLMAFGRKKLDYADVKLKMVMFDEERLDAVAREIEREMMKPTAYRIKEDERIARELRGPLKASKCLRLVF